MPTTVTPAPRPPPAAPATARHRHATSSRRPTANRHRRRQAATPGPPADDPTQKAPEHTPRGPFSAPITSRNRHTPTPPAAEKRLFCALCDPATNPSRRFCARHSAVSALLRQSPSPSAKPVSTVFPSSKYLFAISSALISCSPLFCALMVISC